MTTDTGRLDLALRPVARGSAETRASDRVYATLISAIRRLDLAPGSALSETELARRLGVSRTPIREAIGRLVDQGLLEVVPQVGTRVARIRMAEAEEARFVREHLEIACLREVCKLPGRDVGELRASVARQQRAHRAGDLDGFFEADEEMHRTVFALSGYPGAWQAASQKKLHLDRIRRLSLPGPGTIAELIGEHRAIIDAIEAGDGRSGAALLRRHARRALRYAPDLRAAHPDLFED
ncbi:GntR family transcriptional regulator [Microlunatus speluncae]|uniref:GntR family transcriptional regulator n=1 Tax=Microlunatus speluncae TaxID=2594267 RepID=UPI001C2CE4A0|nr:GntR family transcriptional regulator [Microlunatus speluncae]